MHQVKHAQTKKNAKPKATEVEESARTPKKTVKTEPNSKGKPSQTDDGRSKGDKQASDSKSKSDERSKQPRQKPQPDNAQLEQNIPISNPELAIYPTSTPLADGASPKDAKAAVQQTQTVTIEKPVAKPVTLAASDGNEATDAKTTKADSSAANVDSNAVPAPAEEGNNSDTSPVDEPLSVPQKSRRLSLDSKSAGNGQARSDSDTPTNTGVESQIAIDTDLSGIMAAVSAPPLSPVIESKSKDDQDSNSIGSVPLTDARVSAPAQATQASKPAPIDQTAQFAELNHPKLITAIHGQLLPSGGTMTLRLDPPELGAMHVRVEVRDGLMTASFETSNDQATKLLSHSLDQLKSSLEAQGVTVERLHVTQSSRPQSSSSQNGRQEPSEQRQDPASQQEQQRREMMQRLWRRLLKGQDPLDMVA